MFIKNTIDDFNNFWTNSETDKTSYSREFWEDRANNWISEFVHGKTGKPWTYHRISQTATYLRQHGLIGSESSVVDVGCGAGLFVMEFAKTAKYAMGLDYSNPFIQYGRDTTKTQGIHNADFCVCDFDKADIDEMGLAGKFDLAFSYITPAIFSSESVNKLIKLSRAWCYSANFVCVRDSLTGLVCRDVFEEKYKSHRDGTGFYSLFNILWLMGYRPETTYYVETHTEIFTPTWDNAKELAGRCHHKTQDATEKIFNWLKKQNEIERKVEYTYGGILWDIRIKDERT
jgi:SAM-dependent methyltransferase